MLKGLKLRNFIKMLGCGVMALSVFAECPAKVLASSSEEYPSEMSNVTEDDSTEDASAEDEGTGGEHWRIGTYDLSECMRLTDDIFDVNTFFVPHSEGMSALRDANKMFDGILRINNSGRLEKFILRNEIAGRNTFEVLYGHEMSEIRGDINYSGNPMVDNLREFRWSIVSKTFFRGILEVLRGKISVSDKAKCIKIVLAYKRLCSFIEKSQGVIDVNKAEEALNHIIKLLKKDAKYKTLARLLTGEESLRIVCDPVSVSIKASDLSVVCGRPLEYLSNAYAKLKEADQALDEGNFSSASDLVSESREFMERFVHVDNKSRSALALLLSYSVDEFNGDVGEACERWNKMKNTIDVQADTILKFDELYFLFNVIVNSVVSESVGNTRSVGAVYLNWFDKINFSLLNVGPVDIKSVGDLDLVLEQAAGELQWAQKVYNVSPRGRRIPEILEQLQTLINNVTELKNKIIAKNKEKKLDEQARVAFDEEMRQREERMKGWRAKAAELQSRNRQQKLSSRYVEEPKTDKYDKYEVVYFNEEVRRRCLSFLRDHSGDKEYTGLWEGWFESAEKGGSTTTNSLANLAGGKSFLTGVGLNDVRLCAGDTIREDSLLNRGQKEGMVVVYYMDKGTNRVVIVYVGEHFGIGHKNEMSVELGRAEFVSANKNDWEFMLVSGSPLGSRTPSPVTTGERAPSPVSGAGEGQSAEKDTKQPKDCQKKHKKK